MTHCTQTQKLLTADDCQLLTQELITSDHCHLLKQGSA